MIGSKYNEVATMKYNINDESKERITLVFIAIVGFTQSEIQFFLIKSLVKWPSIKHVENYIKTCVGLITWNSFGVSKNNFKR